MKLQSEMQEWYCDTMDEKVTSSDVGKELAPRMPQGLEIKYDPTLEFNIDKHCIALINKSVFFATISRSIKKIPTWDIPTAGVAFSRDTDSIDLYYNPGFFAWMESMNGRQGLTPLLGDNWISGVLTHELYHLVFDHLGSRRKDQKTLWNIATDAAINSTIISNGDSLPPGLIFPGREPTMMDGTKIPIVPGSLHDVIANWPALKASEWYYMSLMKAAKENGWPSKITFKAKSGGDPQSSDDPTADFDIDSFDDHEGWDNVPDEERELITEKVKQLVEKAVKAADSDADGWGTIPASMREQIRKFISRQIDWRVILRSFIGRLLRGERALSIKRINKKYPYIHPGTKRGYQAKLLICMDQSGSVSTKMIELFFAELSNLTRNVSITVLPFDHTPAVDQMFEWKKGMNPPVARVRHGGTDFNAPCDFANDPKNRGRWDGIIMMTDGECSKPHASRLRRAWVLGPGQKLYFQTDELVINTSDEVSTEGPWR